MPTSGNLAESTTLLQAPSPARNYQETPRRTVSCLAPRESEEERGIDSWTIRSKLHRPSRFVSSTGHGPDTRTTSSKKTPTSDGRRCVNDVLGGPGRNRTTDTRIFKTDVHVLEAVASRRAAQRRIHNVKQATNPDEKCFEGSAAVVSGHKAECGEQDEGSHPTIVAKKTCCGPPIGWSTNRSRQLHSKAKIFLGIFFILQNQNCEQHPTGVRDCCLPVEDNRPLPHAD